MATTTRKSQVRRSVEERKAALMKAKDSHLRHIKTIENKLAALNGKVTLDTVYTNTKKWLESLSTPDLKAHATRVGINHPEDYEDLDMLIESVLSAMFGKE